MVRPPRTSFTSSLSCVIMLPRRGLCYCVLSHSRSSSRIEWYCAAARSASADRNPRLSLPRAQRPSQHLASRTYQLCGGTPRAEFSDGSNCEGGAPLGRGFEVLDGHPRRSLWPGGDSLTPFASSRAHLWTLPLLRVSANYCAGRRASCTRRDRVDRGRARRTSARPWSAPGCCPWHGACQRGAARLGGRPVVLCFALVITHVSAALLA